MLNGYGVLLASEIAMEKPSVSIVNPFINCRIITIVDLWPIARGPQIGQMCKCAVQSLNITPFSFYTLSLLVCELLWSKEDKLHG